MASVARYADFRRPNRRRVFFGVAALVTAVLCVWPRHYLARADLLPQEAAGGLSALLGQGGGELAGLGALLGNHQSIEMDLTVARSQSVLRDVVARLRARRPNSYRDEQRAELSIRKRVTIEAVRGSIIQINVFDADPDLAYEIVSDFVAAIKQKTANLSLQQSAQNRAVAADQLAEATTRLASAQQALGRFRLENKLPSPEAQLGSGVTQLAILQGKLQAANVELQTLQRFATRSNFEVQSTEAEIAGLQHQIADAQTAQYGEAGLSVAAVAQRSSQYLNLYRDEKFAEALYAIYTRYLEQVTIEELSANQDIKVIEPPYVDPAYQTNSSAVGLLLLIVLLAVGFEFYLVKPPVGEHV